MANWIALSAETQYVIRDENGVPVELHIFPEGPHGMGLAGGVPAGQWCGLCQKWLLDLGFGK